MPNIASKSKSMKQDEKERLKNKSFKSQVKTAIKKAKLGLSIKDPKTQELISEASSLIDQAVAKGHWHANKAARVKSKLMKKNHRNKVILDHDKDLPSEKPLQIHHKKKVNGEVAKTATKKTVTKSATAKTATTKATAAKK